MQDDNVAIGRKVTSYVVNGPSCANPPGRWDGNLNASFRLLRYYDATTDMICWRFDILLDAERPEPTSRKASGEQFNSVVEGTMDSYLVKPASIPDCIVFRADEDDLEAIFEGFAKAIKENKRRKADAEEMNRIAGVKKPKK